MIQQSRGFTLIELVVVILILGILSATALPRFLNVNQQAHISAVDGAGGGLGAGVALARAGWLAAGNTAAASNLANFGAGNVDTNANGWPIGINGALDCTEIWLNVMQNPPTLGAAPNDYTVAGPGAGTSCTYTYNAVNTMSIDYDSATGIVTIDDVP